MTWWNNYSIHAVTILSKVTKSHSGPLQQMRLELAVATTLQSILRMQISGLPLVKPAVQVKLRIQTTRTQARTAIAALKCLILDLSRAPLAFLKQNN